MGGGLRTACRISKKPLARRHLRVQLKILRLFYSVGVRCRVDLPFVFIPDRLFGLLWGGFENSTKIKLTKTTKVMYLN